MTEQVEAFGEILRENAEGKMTISDARVAEIEAAVNAGRYWATLVSSNEMAGIIARMRAAEAVVAKLPLSADGVPVVPGMALFTPAYDEVEDGGTVYSHRHTSKYPSVVASGDTIWDGRWGAGSGPHHACEFYSTAEAANAAVKYYPSKEAVEAAALAAKGGTV